MRTVLILVAIQILTILPVSRCTPTRSYSCIFDGNTGSYEIVKGVQKDARLSATFYEKLNTTGWDLLYVFPPSSHSRTPSTSLEAYFGSSAARDDEIMMTCAGLLEAAISAPQIRQWYTTFKVHSFGNSSMSRRLTEYMSTQLVWMRTMVATHRHTDPYWNHVGLVLSQFMGLLEGYNKFSDSQHQLTELEMYALNAAGDLETLLGLLQYPEKALRSNINFRFEDEPEILSCSALVKVLPDSSDLFASHTTWTQYYSMYRIFKNYNLPLQAPNTAASNVIFSSRPGFLCSKDDFYMMNSGLTTMETTNGIYNTSLYQYVVPTTVLTWIRAIVANRMATDAKDWTVLFAMHNSGTYNNQWMAVDYNKFTPGKDIQPDTLWIIEQVPGYTQSADVSDVLAKKKYWGSFNVPYFSFIYNISGYPDGSSVDGQGSVYVQAPRNGIFARDQDKVKGLSGMKYIMQYNDYQHDPLSKGDPANAISSRYDLRTEAQKPAALGGIDSKISSIENIKSMECAAISGPTHQQQTPFSWTPKWNSIFHDGLPNLWNFDWTTILSNPTH